MGKPEGHEAYFEPALRSLRKFYDRGNSRRRRIITWACSLIFGVGIIGAAFVVITWAALRPHKPRYYVDYASISRFDISGTRLETAMSFNLTSRNPNHKIGIYYDRVEAYVYYEYQRIGGAYVAPFYQGHKTTTILRPILTGHSVMVEEDVSRDLTLERNAGTLELTLKIYSKVRFKVATWKSRHYTMKVKCNLLVNVNEPAGIFDHKRCSVYF
eukprot:Gb_14222 [translate_table: standard]